MEAAESQSLTPAGAGTLKRVQRIQPSRWFAPVDVREFWRYRELIRFFVLRDVRTRYRQMHLGLAWMILRPLLTIVIFSAIFGGLAGISPGTNIPYALWVTPGVLVFFYVASALTATSSSLVTNSTLITKVYFPRLYVPISAALTPIADLILGLVVLLGLFAYFHRAPSWRIVFLPAFVALSVLVIMGIGLWFSAFTARYRDVIFVAPFLAQIWQFLTPVIYPATYVSSGHRWLLDLNPLTAVVAGFRWSLLGLPYGSFVALETSVPIAVGLILSGLFVFRRAERHMADML